MFPNDLKRSAIILQALTILLLAGCGGKEAVAPEDVEQAAFDDLRAEVMDVVPDSQRQEAILGLVDDLQIDFSELLKDVVVRRTEIRKLNSDYDATREQFHDYVARYDAAIRQSREKVTASRQKLVEETTVEEWDALKKVETRTMKKMVSLLQAI